MGQGVVSLQMADEVGVQQSRTIVVVVVECSRSWLFHNLYGVVAGDAPAPCSSRCLALQVLFQTSCLWWCATPVWHVSLQSRYQAAHVRHAGTPADTPPAAAHVW